MINRKLSSDPNKSKVGLTDQKCLVCRCTLFFNDPNPCNLCQRSYLKDYDPYDFI